MKKKLLILSLVLVMLLGVMTVTAMADPLEPVINVRYYEMSANRVWVPNREIIPNELFGIHLHVTDYQDMDPTHGQVIRVTGWTGPAQPEVLLFYQGGWNIDLVTGNEIGAGHTASAAPGGWKTLSWTGWPNANAATGYDYGAWLALRAPLAGTYTITFTLFNTADGTDAGFLPVVSVTTQITVLTLSADLLVRPWDASPTGTEPPAGIVPPANFPWLSSPIVVAQNEWVGFHALITNSTLSQTHGQQLRLTMTDYPAGANMSLYGRTGGAFTHDFLGGPWMNKWGGMNNPGQGAQGGFLVDAGLTARFMADIPGVYTLRIEVQNTSDLPHNSYYEVVTYVYVQIIVAEPLDLGNVGYVLFREMRDPSQWFYHIGAPARVDTGVTHGHYGGPTLSNDFFVPETNTFVLNVSYCATAVAIDIAGIIDRSDFELWAHFQPNDLEDFTWYVEWIISVYDGIGLPDDGWGPAHMPAYFIVPTPGLGQSVTLVMVVDGEMFRVEINRASMLTPDEVTITDTSLTAIVQVSNDIEGTTAIISHNLPSGVTAVVNAAGDIVITGVRPAAGQPAIAGTFEVTVERGCATQVLTVNVNLTPLTAPPNGPPVGGGVVTPPVENEYDEEVPLGPLSAYHHAYLIGYTDGTIRPNNNITRAEVATIFFRLLCDDFRVAIWSQTNPFPDVALQDWFNNAISTLAGEDFLLGYPDGYFRPNQAMTRAEFSALLVRVVNGENNGAAGATPFTDIAGHWAEDYIYAAYALGWVQGFGDGTFRPDRQITRAEVAALVNRALNRLPEYPSDLLEDMVTWPDNMNQNAWYYLYIQEATNSHVHELKECGTRETWVELLTPREWWRLERPNSDPTIFTGYYIGEEIGVGE